MKEFRDFPKVYIIILNYNTWADTIECLESVLKNNYPNYQIIVIDNNSPNNSMEYIKRWAEGKLDIWVNPYNPLRTLSFPPIKKPIPYVYYTREDAEKGGNSNIEKGLIYELLKKKKETKQSLNPSNYSITYPLVLVQTGENLGFAGGINVGIKYALVKDDFDYVILLNNDTVVEKNFVIKLITTYKKLRNKGEKKIGLVGCKVNYYSTPRKVWFKKGIFHWYKEGIHLVDKSIEGIVDSEFVTGCVVAIPRYLIKDIGLWDEKYFLYGEDTDYSMRAVKKGYRNFVNTDCLVYHKISATTGGKFSGIQYYYGNRNRLLFHYKHYSKIDFFFFFIVFMLTRIGRAIQFILTGNFSTLKIMIKGILDFFEARKKIKGNF